MCHKKPAYLILTWGCQMNEDDSRQMANLFDQMGYREAAGESDADVIMLNTCSVRAKPEQKVKSKLGELRILKQEKKNLIIGVCGCMAQRAGKELLKRAPHIDIIMGTASIPELPMLVEQVRQGERRAFALDMPEKGSNGKSHIHRVTGKVDLKAFVPVMYGCNNYCSYCVVPYARGPERSRPVEEIIGEIKELVSAECKEVMLVGQNVNSYGMTGFSIQDEDGSPTDCQRMDFASLLEMVDGIPGLERVRFITSHPKDLSDRLIEAIATLPKVCEHLHLPIQAGDDEILRRMGRGYSVEHYLNLAQKLRARIPGVSLTTDFMVGFPGESEEQFRNTLKVVESVRFDSAFTFIFSSRPGTAAAKMEGHIDGVVKTRRLRELMALQEEISHQKNLEHVGELLEVLVEGPSDRNPDKMTGYTRTSKTVNFPGTPELKGQFITVRITRAHPFGFSGEIE